MRRSNTTTQAEPSTSRLFNKNIRPSNDTSSHSVKSSPSLSSLRPSSSLLQLKALRYEDAVGGIPPLAITSVHRKPSASSLSSSSDQHDRSPPRPSPTSTHLRKSFKPHDDASVAPAPKRDSGIATSLSTEHDRSSYAESHASSAAGGVAREPSLPTIVVQDDETTRDAAQPLSPSFSQQSADEYMSRASSYRDSPDPMSTTNTTPLLPTYRFDDIDLKDLCSDKVDFSKRGSLLFRGKNMQELIAAQGQASTADADPLVSPIRSEFAPSARSLDLVASPTLPSSPSAAVRPAETPLTPQHATAPSPGLVSGRRKPSVHMMQAALQDGRVLSAEEISFSLKLRSMYEHGTEQAATWTTPVTAPPPNPDAAQPVTDESSVSGPKANGQADVDLPARSGAHSSLGFVRESTEIAGGIEDWGDVHGADVDRYGFIQMHRTQSRASNASSPVPGQGVQRVATSLRLAAEPSRYKRRSRMGLTPARSSRSLPPRPGSEGTDGRSAGSLRSFSSTVSTRKAVNPFRSRQQKTLDEASDMLTFVPGLADIAEQEDGNNAPSQLKRREWQREEKWQKMARPIGQKSSAKGGGMDFTFDISDGKLVSRTWKGIPDRWRATVWHSFLSASAAKRGSNVPDEQLIQEFHRLQEQNSADDVQIDMDVPRTVSMHIMFRRRYRGGQRLLFRVLHAIGLYFPHIGYVQGMASLAATLLCYYEEEKAFVMMVRLWQLRGLEQLFTTGFQGLMTALGDFEKDWLGEGDVARKLQELGVHSTSYGTRWYLTLFNMSIPFSAQLRVWDVFMLLGDASTPDEGKDFGGADLDVLHATSAALIDATREIILDSDFENAMKVLTSFVPIRDEDLLMRVARTEWQLRKKRAAKQQ